MITAADAQTFERCMAVGGVAVFGADTVYGLACEPDTQEAVTRLYAMKGRPSRQPAAVMFFSLDLALAALPELGARSAAAVQALLPGAFTLLLPNPAGRFPLACGPDPSTLGLRVPALAPTAAALEAVRWPILQSSANRSGGPDPRSVEEVPEAIRAQADLILDAGPLGGAASTIVDLRDFEHDGSWRLVREGAVSHAQVAGALSELPGNP